MGAVSRMPSVRRHAPAGGVRRGTGLPVRRRRRASDRTRFGRFGENGCRECSLPRRPVRRAAPSGRPARPGAGDPAALGGRQGLRPHASRARRAGRSGCSTRDRRPPTAARARTTSRPAPSRTSSPASRPCRASTSPAAPAGTATACPSRSPSSRSSASPASPTSSATASRSSTPAAGSPSSGTSTRSPSSPTGWATGSTCPRPTGRWTPSYIESVWWSLKQIFDKGLLVEDHRVAPYCPRCGTGLSDHEVAQGYETLTDPSVYVRLPVTSGEWAGKADLLIWTTTPWTLPSNTAVADAPGRHLRGRARTGDGHVRRRRAAAVARSWARTARGPGPHAPGRDWERVTYQRPFELVEFPDDNAHYVVLADYVTTEDGTGPGAPVPRVRRRRPRRHPRLRHGRGQPGRRRPGTSCPRSRWSAGTSSRPPTPPWSRTSRSAASCSGSSATSTAIRTAGAATRRSCTTRSRPGTSARRRSRTSCSPRTRRRTGIPRASRPAATATG